MLVLKFYFSLFINEKHLSISSDFSKNLELNHLKVPFLYFIFGSEFFFIKIEFYFIRSNLISGFFESFLGDGLKFLKGLGNL